MPRAKIGHFPLLFPPDFYLKKKKGETPGGVAALQRFLNFAETDYLEIPKQSVSKAGSLFEEEGAEALRNLGC